MNAILRISGVLLACASIAACADKPVIDDDMKHVDGPLPANFGGSWERNYTRGNDINGAFYEAYNRMVRTIPDNRYPGEPTVVGPSSKDVARLTALARLAEDITRTDVLTIAQNEHEISIARKDDFSLLCAFYNGVAKGTDSPYGTEICGWDGEQLVSNLLLPGGLQVTHRFTVSADEKQLRVVTTVSSSTSRVPVTLYRFYTKFERPASDFNCIETLSMKRVCSTAPLVP